MMLMILVIVLIALILNQFLASNVLNKTKRTNSAVGGYSSDGPSAVTIADQTYEKISQTLKDVGSGKHIEKYLAEVLDVKSVELSEYVQGRHTVEHKNVLEMLIMAAEQTEATSPEELILLLDLRYCWFLPGDKGKLLQSKKLDKSNSELVLIDLVDEYSRNSSRTLLMNEKEKLVKKFKSILGLYKRFAGDISKTSADSLKRKSEIVVDKVGLSGLVKIIVDRATGTGSIQSSSSYTARASTITSIADKLNAVDLIEMYPREPYLVKSFIERIKKQIEVIEYNTDNWRNIAPFGTQALRATLHDLALRDIIRNKINEERPRWERPTQAVKEVPYRVTNVPTGAVALESKNNVV